MNLRDEALDAYESFELKRKEKAERGQRRTLEAQRIKEEKVQEICLPLLTKRLGDRGWHLLDIIICDEAGRRVEAVFAPSFEHAINGLAFRVETGKPDLLAWRAHTVEEPTTTSELEGWFRSTDVAAVTRITDRDSGFQYWSAVGGANNLLQLGSTVTAFEKAKEKDKNI